MDRVQALVDQANDASFDGKYDEALLLLKEATVGVEVCLRSRPRSPVASPISCGDYLLENVWVDFRCKGTPSSLQMLNESGYVFFDRVFSWTTERDQQLDSDLPIMLSVLKFNQAINLHCKYLSSATQSYWDEALSAYCHSVELLVANPASLVDAAVLVLAILNNIGHLHSLHYNMKHEYFLLQVIEDFLSHVLSSNAVPTTLVEHMPFFTNLIASRRSFGAFQCAASA